MGLWQWTRRIALVVVGTSWALFAEETPSKEELLAIIEKISKQQEQLTEEIDHLKRLLGAPSILDDLSPLAGTEAMSEVVHLRTDDGIQAFNKRKFISAKDDFRYAWEEDSNLAITNYNLGLAYHHLGKKALAKRMLKTAIGIDTKIQGIEKIHQYLAEGTDTEEKEPSKESETLSNELINLKKEVKSYLSSSSLPAWRRMKESAAILEEIIEKVQEDGDLVEEHFPWAAETYAAFEWYDRAIQTLDVYEKSMEGKILPDGYHKKRLAIVEKKKSLDESLEEYVSQELEKENQRKLRKDLRELEIFATQIEEFVQKAEKEDPDFIKICHRLKEYRWGGRQNRHVLVVNRFQELLYSSLPGTLPIDRYQDRQGKKFLKNITLLADQLGGNHSLSTKVDLNLNGKIVPYVVLYTYIPKHQLFVIVRLPEKDIYS